MVSKTGRAFVEVLAALLCVTTAFARNHGTPEQKGSLRARRLQIL
jgi:hypothetical protein